MSGGTRDLLGLLSKQLGRPVIFLGEGDAAGHDWEASARKGMPILACKQCPVVWWPDRREPQGTCKGAAGGAS